MTKTNADAPAVPTVPQTRGPRSEASKQWARLDDLDRYLLQAVCTMEKIRDTKGVAAVGRLTARPRAYDDLVEAGAVFLIAVDERVVLDVDQVLDTHRVVPTAMGTRLVRAAHAGKWIHTKEWTS